MDSNNIFQKLWDEYSTSNPSAGKIFNLFRSEGEEVVNDHIAFRTIDHPAVCIDKLSEPFRAAGFKEAGEYVFKDKHLFAKHFELPGNEKAPRVFISELKRKDFSEFVQKTFSDEMEKVLPSLPPARELIYAGSVFKPLSYDTYLKLREESEYAAWFYVFGFRANHFTVSVNWLKKHNDIYKVNELLKKNGYLLNTSGGEVKGTKEELLQQSSTMADIVKVKFDSGVYDIPLCYYEFAQRHKGPDGKVYSGFIPASADKIFESTNFYKPK
jgi:hypothetical protein